MEYTSSLITKACTREYRDGIRDDNTIDGKSDILSTRPLDPLLFGNLASLTNPVISLANLRSFDGLIVCIEIGLQPYKRQLKGCFYTTVSNRLDVIARYIGSCIYFE